MAIRRQKNPHRVFLSTCVSTIVAHLLVGNTDKAKEQAKKLVNYLRTLGLVD